jgi:ubiquinone/menaquinone biosynthesis C-methylase UbiE
MPSERWLVIIVLVLVVCVIFILNRVPQLGVDSAPQSSELSPSQMIADAYTAKAASYDMFRTLSPGWDSLEPTMKSLPKGLRILDLGCGSGAFLAELSLLSPSTIDATDRNLAMIQKATTRAQKVSSLPNAPAIHVRQADVTDLPDDHYDIVFCAQVIQNLTPDPSLAMATREQFLLQIYRILKPKGQVVLTTRAVSPGVDGRWSNLYWYADPAIVPRAVKIMEDMVPRNPIREMEGAGFVEVKQVLSKDTVVRFDAYRNPHNLKNPAFRSADSFFQHVNEVELQALLKNIETRVKDGTIGSYVKERDALRGDNGHVVTLVGLKPAAASAIA